MYFRSSSLRSARTIRGIVASLALVLIVAFVASSQPKYRTFDQVDLSQKKAKAGKVTGTTVTFTLKNPRLTPVYGFHAILSAKLIAIMDSGGFTNFSVDDKRAIDAMGPGIEGGDSVTVTFLVANRKQGTVINYFWWTDQAGERRTSTETKIPPIADEQHYILPNGGNVREFLYKKVLTRPEGLVLGIVAPDQGVGWVRNLSANGKYFPHTGAPRCLDYTVSSSGVQKAITRQLRNIHYKKHNNRLLGELHALKLAIAANDAGITEPTDPDETRIGDLFYNDGGNPEDPFNGMTLRQAAHLVDSALTFCGNFSQAMYAKLDSSLERINSQFVGAYKVRSFDPFVLEGTATLAEAGYLHANPGPPPALVAIGDRSIVESEVPSAYALSQNFPNPFNPTTSIEFSLAEPSVVTLRVYDLLGREVASLIEGEEMEDGAQLVNFDADGLTSGIYYYRLTAQGTGEAGGYFDDVRKMLLLR
jgi:hypothetical protein